MMKFNGESPMRQLLKHLGFYPMARVATPTQWKKYREQLRHWKKKNDWVGAKNSVILKHLKKEAV